MEHRNLTEVRTVVEADRPYEACNELRCYAAVLVIMLVICAPSGAVFAQNKPAAEIRPPVWDYGYLPQKSEVTHDFYICNTCSVPITVARIEAGCSCTSVSEVDNPIAPGDSVAIAVTFKSGRYHKKVKKTTKVHIEGDDKPVLKHRIESYIIKKKDEAGDVTIEPGRLEWEIDGNELTPRCDTLTITNSSQDTLSIAIIHTSKIPIYEIDCPDNLLPGQQGDIMVKTEQQTSLEETNGLSATFLITGQDTTRITVPIEIDN